MPAPHDYDDEGIVIRVHPHEMFAGATVTIPMYGQKIADIIGDIINIWNELKLGWAGPTPEAVEGFFKEWSNANADLFGTEDDPHRGVLDKIANGVAMAAMNYAETESALTKTFGQFSSAIESAPSDGSSNPTRDLSQGPISEKTLSG